MTIAEAAYNNADPGASQAADTDTGDTGDQDAGAPDDESMSVDVQVSIDQGGPPDHRAMAEIVDILRKAQAKAAKH